MYYINGRPVILAQVIDGKTYYFDKNGRTVSGKQTIDGMTYYFDLTGAMI